MGTTITIIILSSSLSLITFLIMIMACIWRPLCYLQQWSCMGGYTCRASGWDLSFFCILSKIEQAKIMWWSVLIWSILYSAEIYWHVPNSILLCICIFLVSMCDTLCISGIIPDMMWCSVSMPRAHYFPLITHTTCSFYGANHHFQLYATFPVNIFCLVQKFTSDNIHVVEE